MTSYDPHCQSTVYSEDSDTGHQSRKWCRGDNDARRRADSHYRDTANTPGFDHEAQLEHKTLSRGFRMCTFYSRRKPTNSEFLVPLTDEHPSFTPTSQASITTFPLSHCPDTSNYITDNEAATIAIRCLDQEGKEVHGRILRNKLTQDDSEHPDLNKIAIACNVTIFNDRLCGNQCWVPDLDNPESDQRTLATTFCRRLPDGSVETTVSLSIPISLSGDRQQILRSFLRELIHAYLFVCCGPEVASCNRAFSKIAEALDEWIGKPLLRLSSVENDLVLSAGSEDACKKEVAELPQQHRTRGNEQETTDSDLELETKELEPYHDDWEPTTRKEEYCVSSNQLLCTSEKCDSERQLAWQPAASLRPVRPFLDSIYQAVCFISWNLCFCFHGDDIDHRR